MKQKHIYTSQRALPGRWRFPFFYGWVIVAVVFIAEFNSAGMGTQTIGLFFTALGNDLGWSLTQLVGAIIATTIAGMIVSPIIGPLLDRYGARPVMLFGAVIAGVGLLLLSRIQEVWQFWVLYGVVGALGLNEMGMLTGPVVIAKWFIRRRGRAMAIGTIGTTIGGMTMAPIIGLLIGVVGWRYTWALMGVVVLVSMVPIIFLFIRRQPEDVGLRPDGDGVEAGSLQRERVKETTTEPATPQIDEEPVWTRREAFGTRSLWLIIISLNLVSVSASTIIILTVPFFTEQEGMSTQAASYIITLRLLFATISRLAWGFVAERIPIRFALAGLFLCRAIGTLSLVVIPHPLNIFTMVFFVGLGGAIGLLQPMTMANYFGRPFLGSIQGALRPFMSLPQLAGPLFAAYLFDRTGTFDLAFLIMAALALVATVTMLFATPPIHRNANTKEPAHG